MTSIDPSKNQIVLYPTILASCMVAYQLDVNVQTAQRLCRTGAIKAHKKNNRWYVLPSDLKAYVVGEEEKKEAA